MNTEKPSSKTSPSRPLTVFLAVQAILVGVAAAGAGYRYLQVEADSELPALALCRAKSQPENDEPQVITDRELASVLRKLRPRFDGVDTKIGIVDHNLRFWGVEATFDDPAFVSGEQMRKLLLDHRAFTKLYGETTAKAKPLLIEVPADGGVRIREFEGALSASHDDHTMACLAESGTPLNYPVVTPTRTALFRDLVEQSLRDFSLNQVEYEWSAVTYALFVDQAKWRSREGQLITFDLLADRIMREKMPHGVCMGNHRLHALVMILRVDDMWEGPTPLLTPAKRQEIIDYLQSMTLLLTAHQHADGFWNSDWPTATPQDRRPGDSEGDRLGDRIIATGHALEWWALVPQHDKTTVLPDHEVLIRAAHWLVRTVEEMSDKDVQKNGAYLSHAGRALALWRGKYPYQVDLSAADEPADAPATEPADEPADAAPGDADATTTNDTTAEDTTNNSDAPPDATEATTL